MQNRRSIKIKLTSFFFILIHLIEVCYPTISYALTGGPSQPEVQSFEPVGTSEMVDLFSGDFNYNIPLLDVGGYPINIAYHAGVTMDQEASWVGLGWNINAGVINRDMRGLPDDFKGDLIEKETHIRPNINTSANLGLPIYERELFGLKKYFKEAKLNVGLNIGVRYNNYKGIGFDFGFSPTMSIGQSNSTKLTAGLGLNYSSSGGVNVNPSLGLSNRIDGELEKGAYAKTGVQVGTSFNSRQGLQAFNYGISYGVNNKKNTEIAGKSIGSSHSFGIQTYTPQISMPMKTHSLTMSIGTGPEYNGAFPKINLSGSYSQTVLSESSSSKNAYGYMYEDAHRVVEEQDDHDFLLDYNRENDGSFTKKTKNLPLTNHTYDIYSVAGHGVGGSYRLFRGDIGIIGDDYSKTTSSSGSGGFELGYGNLVHFGIDVNATFHKSESGAWVGNRREWIRNKPKNKYNVAREIFGFRGLDLTITSIDYEASYFKKAGEMLPIDDANYNFIKNNQAIALNPLSLEESSAISFISNKPNTSYSTSNYLRKSDKVNTLRKKRDKRNQIFNPLTVEQRSIAGLTKYFNYDDINPPIYNEFPVSRVENPRPNHHTSEISIVGEDGMRYYYGIPAYNNIQKEVAFNVSGRSKNNAIGQVEYNAGSDNTINNRQGKDHYYNKTTTPAYAHSYLLTGIVSSDYVDLTGDGISNDDFGTSVKVNYSRVYENYNWRVPYNQNKASLSEGIRSTDNDDKGSYVYGQKEIWHISSIESKTHIAFFRISLREDGLGVLGENGGKNTAQKSYKLDKIELYSKQDIEFEKLNAKPVKVVHFQYDYSLCPNIDNSVNSGDGKLTLKKVWFTYGTSHRGRTAPYSFEYAGINGQSGINPQYNLKGNDAWGNYKEMKSNDNSPNGELSNSDYPYTDSDKSISDINSYAWCLTQINLPSGGKIKVTYEADDYGYVENNRALEMTKIAGFGNFEDKINDGDRIFNASGKDRHTDLIFFNLKEAYSGTNPSEYIKKRYLENLNYIQFNVFAYLRDKKGASNDVYEYVKGYCEIDWTKGCGMTSSTEAWVAIKKMHINDKDDGNDRQMVNPIAKTIWNHTRLYLPHLVYPEPNNLDQNAMQQIKSLLHVIGSDFYRNFRGINKSLEDQKFGYRISKNKSWIRLNSPDKKRIGGGHRVKKIEMSDEWQEMAFPTDNNATSIYGQEYDYTKQEIQTNGEVWEISSGVAANIPGFMSDEHPLVQPRFSNEDYVLVSDIETYEDRPIGESFFQGANVGYSQVKVRSITPTSVVRTAAGYTVNEFYTAFDYPTVVSSTELIQHHIEPMPFFSMFQIKREHKAMAGQGFSIELNDMHGKPKAQYTFGEGKKDPLSWSKSYYKTNSKFKPQILNNKVLTISPDNTIKEKEIGVEYDFVIDNRQQEAITYSAGINFNTEAFSLLVFPVVVPCIIPSFSKEEVGFKSTVGTKVIKRYGVLDSTVAFQEGSSITTSNLLYDDQTGEVLLTSVENEFNDRVYNLTYPAHWAYEGMGQAYKNIGFYMNQVKIKSDAIVFPNNINSANYLVPGDECLVQYPNGIEKIGWVYLGNGNKLNFIDDQGYPLDNGENIQIKVIRSGRRNTPKSPISTFTTLSNPLVKAPNGSYSLNIINVTNTEAIEYKENWKTHLDLVPYFKCDTLGSDNYRNFVNFIDDLPNHQKMVKTKYLVTDDLSQYSEFNRNDSIFKIQVLIHQKGGGGYIGKDTCNYGDSIFIRYCWLDSNDQSKCYPKQLAEIVGIVNYIPRPKILQYDNYDHFWAKVKRTTNPLINLSTMANKTNAYRDSLLLHIGKCNEGVLANQVFLEYKFSTQVYNSKYRIYLNNDCYCDDMELIFNKPNRYKTVLDYYNYQPHGTNTIKCKVIVLTENNQQDTIDAIVKSCIPLMKCQYYCGDAYAEKVINPYRANMLGNWRPFKSYKYLGERTYQAGSPNTRSDGKYTTFSSYWNYNAGSKKHIANNADNKWVNASEITEYTPFGNEVENKDALGNYSAALFGYQNTLTTAVASNCRYNQLAFDGFEDYSITYGNTISCNQGHFNFKHALGENTGISLDNTQQHSGNFSLKLDAGKTAQIERFKVIEMLPSPAVNENEVRVVRLEDEIGVFRPGAGKYIIGAWVKSETLIGDTTYSNGLIEVEILDVSNNLTVISVNPVGNIIEGWQRVEAVFELPTDIKSIKIKLNANENSATWFDDIRVHTYDGNMKSYVYDAKHLKLRAELDENNYATFYEYDQEGSLIRVKKETVNGIVTLKEVRNHVKGKN